MSELYKATFPAGSKVRVVDEVALEAFARDWHYHHRLQPEQDGVRRDNRNRGSRCRGSSPTAQIHGGVGAQ